ncbi:hypothetical protein [Aeromonas veronii]|uniref:hypothetical protein n=1 Tax=Aeromonas veronii TaxID=654 RepID=UPI0035B76DDA
MNVTVFGCGYVGLVQAVLLADVGHNVVCLDIDEENIYKLSSGILPNLESCLETIFIRNFERGLLKFTTEAPYAVRHGDVQFIAVGSSSGDNGHADLDAVKVAVQTIGQYRKRDVIIVSEPTLPVDILDNIFHWVKLTQETLGNEFLFHVVPNFIIFEKVRLFESSEMVGIGSGNKCFKVLMYELYESFNRRHEHIMLIETLCDEFAKKRLNFNLECNLNDFN